MVYDSRQPPEPPLDSRDLYALVRHAELTLTHAATQPRKKELLGTIVNALLYVFTLKFLRREGNIRRENR